MNITAFSIDRNRITFSLLAIVIVMGLVLYQDLARDSMPPYTVRVATIISYFPGGSPERVEMLVTDAVEKKAQEIPEVKTITSTSRTGLSVVTVELKDEVTPEKLQPVWDNLRRKLEDIENLPEGVVPDLDDDDVGVVYGIMLGLLSDGFSYAEMKEYVDDIRDELIKLDAAAKVELNGVQDERVFIEFDQARLSELGLSSYQLKEIISSTNIIYSGGEVDLEDERIVLEPSGNYDELDDLRNTIVPVGGQLIYLGDFTKIRKGYITPQVSKVRVNGMRSIGLSISLKEGANIIALGQQVDQVAVGWNNRMPHGLELIRLASLDNFVDDSVNSFIGNLIQSIVIVLLVMLVFLGFRTGTIIASLIPIVTVATLMVMGLLEIGLNQVSLAALIMALGMMVDNAIVVSESILVKMEEGVDAKKAAIDSCSELIIPLLISTLTTSAAFLSFFLAESTMGDIMGPIFVVITIALMISWLVSMSIITLLCFIFLASKSQKKEGKKLIDLDKIFEVLKVEYKKILDWALRSKTTFILLVVGMFILSIFGFKIIPFIFFPDSDRNLVTVDINLPLGKKIETTDEVVRSIEQFISDSLVVNESRAVGVLDWSSFIGKGPNSYDLGYSQDEPNSSYAHMLVNTSSGDDNQMVINVLDDFCFNNFPDADIKVNRLGQGGAATPIEIRISGEDPGQLFEISDQVKTKLTGIAGAKNVKDDWGPMIKKFVIDIDQTKAQRAGISSQDIAVSLQTVLSGFVTGYFREDDKSIPIMMRSHDSDQQTFETLETLNIYSQSSGKTVPLIQVANIEPVFQFAKILRYDLFKTVTVQSYLKDGANTAVIMSEMLPWLDEYKKSWPQGYNYALGGDDESTKENMGAVISYLPLSVFIIIMLLIIQFNSMRKTFIVLSTIPLGIIGVVIGLIVLKSYFGFMAFLGVISLAGIVINNAIVLIDRIDIEINELGKAPGVAVVDAALQRFRPILLTTFTTTLGLIPLYLGGGLMWEPMAAAIMVGLLFATVITLMFVPVLYSIMFKVKH